MVVGHLNKAHGTRGELFLWPLTDRPDDIFVPGASFRLADPSGTRPEIGLPDVTMESLRPFRRGFLVQFEGIETRNQAILLTDRYLLLPFEQVPPLEEGEVHYHQLLGSRVRTVGGDELGEVVEVYELQPHDLLEVQTRTGTVLIPFSARVVVEVDMEEGLLVVDPPEGLLDL